MATPDLQPAWWFHGYIDEKYIIGQPAADTSPAEAMKQLQDMFATECRLMLEMIDNDLVEYPEEAENG